MENYSEKPRHQSGGKDGSLGTSIRLPYLHVQPRMSCAGPDVVQVGCLHLLQWLTSPRKKKLASWAEWGHVAVAPLPAGKGGSKVKSSETPKPSALPREPQRYTLGP